MMMKNKAGMSKAAITLSIIAVVLTTVVSLGKISILGIAGTQWMEIAILFAVYAIYLNCCTCTTGENK
jgi:uncharacterized membrane protein YbhN (UPF0104 family)